MYQYKGLFVNKAIFFNMSCTVIQYINNFKPESGILNLKINVFLMYFRYIYPSHLISLEVYLVDVNKTCYSLSGH